MSMLGVQFGKVMLGCISMVSTRVLSTILAGDGQLPM